MRRITRLLLLLTLVGLARPVAASADAAPERVQLTAGRSTVLQTDFDVTRMAVTDPAIADAVVVRPREILVDGKAPGTVSLILWGAETRRQFDVVVDRGAPALQLQLREIFPGEPITVALTSDAVVLSGTVSDQSVLQRAVTFTRAAMPKAQVVNLLQPPGGSPSQQVLLQVRVAEVNRNALLQAGLTLFSTRTQVTARTTTSQFPAPDFNDKAGETGLEFQDFLNLFFFNRKEGLGGVLKALQGRGLLQSLAEPNLIAYNGQEASFLAGGEIPVPVVQGIAGQVTVQWKEFGIRLNFTPTITGDLIRLKLRPEVSALDFGNGIILQGFRIPALLTRRAETDVELRDGQSFAIAGLLNNMSQTDRQAVPILGRLPILGPIFRSRAARQERTELMVLVTPRLVRPLAADQLPALPTDPGEFLPPPSGTTSKPPREGAAGPVDAPPMPDGRADTGRKGRTVGGGQ